jgi:hydroxymethylglutaryl-CoA synthase
MAGIKSYGAYIPYYRMPRSVISAAWGRGGGRGELAIAGYDEDAVSMSVSAGIDCLKGTDPHTVDAIYLATTTPPYLERLSSNIASNALDFRRDVRNADFGNGLRAGVAALMSAVDAVGSGSLKSVLVTASDLRMGTPGGEHEQTLGDGAAAFLVENDAVAVEIEGSLIRSWEDRFGRDAGYSQIPVEVVKNLLEKLNLTPQDISKACIAGANARAQASLARAMKFAPEQVQDPLLDNVGNTGVAHPLMILISALEDAKPGERFLMVSWGTGCDAVVFKTTDQIEKIKDRRAIKRHLGIKATLDNYGKYMRWRSIVPTQIRARGGISMSAEWRERKLGLALYGVKCLNCGTVQLYMRGSSMRAHVCVECQARDNFEPYSFADKTGKVVTFSHDFLGGGINPPMTRAVVNFEGGGRGLFDLVDRDPEECKVGMDVEMTFRMTRTAENAKSYFWKIKPVRE